MGRADAILRAAGARGAFCLSVILLGAAACAAVVDRVAVVVGSHVITESEVIEEARVTQFLNGDPVDLSPAARRAAAERLVDQQLIRVEMEVGGYAMPEESEAQALLVRVRNERSRGAEEFRSELERYGLTERQLLEHLRWQIAAMGFTEVRFSQFAPRSEPARQGAADRQASDGGTQAAAAGSNATVDEMMEEWLQRTRSETRIRFKEEAFK